MSKQRVIGLDLIFAPVQIGFSEKAVDHFDAVKIDVVNRDISRKWTDSHIASDVSAVLTNFVSISHGIDLNRAAIDSEDIW
ncbi:hypothetical protein N7457_000114 [Penicillium paradoxum]|uniref:uncharacterized protein n=1 Tax=Penicillium paradoxum TaxID=176176 RepID=UPI0025487658|nr:uncharacterized protein N7457_000114 [Penicillium paradoxum]KAJ5793515.1 hypothetical protein N7457_000114 [Penicillium paradoxum]